MPAAVAALLVIAAMLAVAPGSDAATKAKRAQGPNVIVFNTDDQPASAFAPELMPATFKRIVERGTEFTDFVVSTPLCCPSRAVLATGQYGHNNGVLTNSYNRLQSKRNVLPRWLQRAGYRTIHVGRFFNGYEGQGREQEVAPGWHTWRTMLQPRRYYNYWLSSNGGRRFYGEGDPDNHLTKVLGKIASRIVAKRSERRRPFYLQLDFFAPHIGAGREGQSCAPYSAVPAPEDEGRYPDEPLPQGPSFNEADFSDKPAFMQGLRQFGTGIEAEIERRWRCMLRSLRSVDREIGRVISALRSGGAAKRTAIVFTSDNGYHYGEQRIALRKHYPYEPSLRVPFAIRLPASLAAQQPPRSGAPVANVDIVPTLLELTGAEPCLRNGCRTLDGRSLLGEAGGTGEPIPPGRAIVLGYDQTAPRDGLVCTYAGLRTTAETIVLHSRTRTGESAGCEQETAIEHYDRVSDPFQLENLFPAPEGSDSEAGQRALLARLFALAACSGIAGRDPLPESGSHCE